jgi:hypothetical protein
MRLFLGCILAVVLGVLPAAARANGEANDNLADAKAADASSSRTSAGATAKRDVTAEPAKSSLESELEELRDLLQTQAQQLQAQQQKLQLLEERLKISNTTRENAAAVPATPSGAVASAVSVPVPTASASAAQPVPAATPAPQAQAQVPDSPLQLRIGSAYITPIGFMDFTGVFRNHNAGGGIGSNFGAIPYEFAAAPTTINLLNHVNEARLSIQNSRIGFRVDALVKGAHVIG